MESITRSGIITLTTDFGNDDAYVGIVKGVILGIFPKAQIVDITHNIMPQDIMEASFILSTSVKYFPRGTVHLAVVDPGVGTARRPILVVTGEYFLIGPDNGIFSDFLTEDAKVYHADRGKFFLRKVSQTFHARDVFGPVSAYLAKGTEPEQIGEPISDPVRIERPQPVADADRVVGSVIYVDRFGNLITNIRGEQLDKKSVVRVMGKDIQGISERYGGHQKGMLLAIIGSAGLLEISLACDNAARRLKAGVGQTVEVRKL